MLKDLLGLEETEKAIENIQNDLKNSTLSAESRRVLREHLTMLYIRRLRQKGYSQGEDY